MKLSERIVYLEQIVELQRKTIENLVNQNENIGKQLAEHLKAIVNLEEYATTVSDHLKGLTMNHNQLLDALRTLGV